MQEPGVGGAVGHPVVSSRVTVVPLVGSRPEPSIMNIMTQGRDSKGSQPDYKHPYCSGHAEHSDVKIHLLIYVDFKLATRGVLSRSPK